VLIILPIEAQVFQNTLYGYDLSLLFVVILGALYILLKSSVYGLGGIFPSKYMNAVMNGNGLGGVIIVVIRAITLLCLPTGNEDDINQKNLVIGTLLYFIVGGIVLAICIFLMIMLTKMQFTKYYFSKSKVNKNANKIATPSTFPNSHIEAEDSTINVLLNSSTTGQIQLNSVALIDRPNGLLQDSLTTDIDNYKQIEAKVDADPTYREILGTIYLLVILVTCSLTITTYTYPGLAMHTSITFIYNKSWFSVFITAIANITSTFGRFSVHYFAKYKKWFAILIVVARTPMLYTYLAIAANYQPTWLFGSDWFKITNLAYSSFTDGYVVTFLMVYAPKLIPPQGKQKTSFFMTFGIVTGAFVGALIADFGIKGILS